MAKYKLGALTGDWWFWWEFSFDHYPFEYRHPDSYHVLHCYRLMDVWPWPEMIWYQDYMTEAPAKGLLDVCLANPELLADACVMCNNYKGSLPHLRYNIHQGENGLWIPKLTYYEPL
jgi:hypothetical protein